MGGLFERLRGRRSASRSRRPPTGTVTFVLTDIEGSTRLWENEPDVMEQAILRHNEIVASAVERNGGTLIRERGEGDSTFSVFEHAAGALAAMLDVQRELVREAWPTSVPIRARAALHTGDGRMMPPHPAGDEYASPAINRCARIRELASGSQVLLSEHTAELVGADLPEGARLLDLGPHRLRDLSRAFRIYQLCHADLPEEFPALRSLEATLHNLPVQLTSFIGRETEIGEVRKLLAANRLLNITGPGGIGKTRLALRVAGSEIDSYPDGVWFVDLAPVTDGNLVPDAVWSALSLREEAGRSAADVVVDHLRSAKALLVFDNCEHLLGATQSFANTLLRSCVEVTILATGREPLHVAGATNWRVPMMAVPGPDEVVHAEAATSYDGVALFCERAALVRPDFSLTHGTAPLIAQICRRLDGVPLAIELAAAAMASLSPNEINAKLDDRFRLLTRGGPDVPRHETLLAALDWSHDLLSEKERAILRRLSVFVGGFTLEAAESVSSNGDLTASEVVSILGALVDKSLIVMDDSFEWTRYGMLETIRDYAAEKLEASDEGDETRERHLRYFEGFSQQANAGLTGPDQGTLLNTLAADHDNLRAALRLALDSKPERALMLGTALRRFWATRGHWKEARRWLEDALNAASSPPEEQRADAISALGWIAYEQGDIAGARERFEEGLEMRRRTGDRRHVGDSLSALAGILHALGERERVPVLYREALDIAREIGDEELEIGALNGLAIAATSTGDHQTAADMFEGAVLLARKRGARSFLASLLINYGKTKAILGHFDDAQRAYEETQQIARELSDPGMMWFSLSALGDAAQDRGDLNEARSYYTESVEVASQVEDKIGIANGSYRLGEIVRMQGTPAEALAPLEVSLQLFEEAGHKQGVAGVLYELGLVHRELGQPQESAPLLVRSLDQTVELGYKDGTAYTLDAIAGLYADRGDYAGAARLFGAAQAAHNEIGRAMPHSSKERRNAELERLRAELGDSAYDAAFEEGRALSFDEALELAKRI